MTSRVGRKSHGFTIIEVLIVVAIAGIILAIVLLAVPATQRTSRNYERKRTATFIFNQALQYYTDTGGLPVTDDDGAAFIAGYLQTVSARYTIDFRDNSGDHSEKPDFDTFFIQYGHWCASHGGVDLPGDPIASAPGGDENNHYYAVYTRLEKNTILCLDNG